MIIRWLDDAVNDLQTLRHYISQDNFVSANRVAKKILHAVNMLSEHPGLGRQGRIVNTKELIVVGTHYIVPYRVKNNVIEISRVLHSAMQWPEDI